MRNTSHTKLGAISLIALNLILVGCTSPVGSTTGNKVAQEAQKRVGTSYRRGVRRQCANFVGYCMTQAGIKPPAAKATAASYRRLGSAVSVPARGDLVLFHGTYNGPNYVTHIGIMVDRTHFVHRPTFAGTVRVTPLSAYRGHIVGFRRLPGNQMWTPAPQPAMKTGARMLAEGRVAEDDTVLLVALERFLSALFIAPA